MSKMSSWGLAGIKVATAKIFFEKRYENCKFCPLLETYSRNMCRLTGELVADTNGRGYRCPLEFEEDDNESVSTSETE